MTVIHSTRAELAIERFRWNGLVDSMLKNGKPSDASATEGVESWQTLNGPKECCPRSNLPML